MRISIAAAAILSGAFLGSLTENAAAFCPPCSSSSNHLPSGKNAHAKQQQSQLSLSSDADVISRRRRRRAAAAAAAAEATSPISSQTTPRPPGTRRSRMGRTDTSSSTVTASSTPTSSTTATTTATTRTAKSASILDRETLRRRETILNRDGEHFDLDRFGGKVEFGSTADLVTPLRTKDTEPTLESIGEWLSDARRVAGGLWDESLLTNLGDSTYRLGLMPLQFVTIQLAPTVDVKMWTTDAEDEESGRHTFRLHSIGFDPNVQILPGVGLDAKSLGIEIEVCGELRPTADGSGVTGKIGFVSSGELPPPMRVLPESVLSAAGATISRTVREFAVANFQAGAVKQYQKFMVKRQQEGEL